MTGGDAAGGAFDGADFAGDDVDAPETAPIPLPPASPFTPFSWTAASSTTPQPERVPAVDSEWDSQVGQPPAAPIGATHLQPLEPGYDQTPARREDRFTRQASPFTPARPSGRRRTRLALAIAAAVVITGAIVTVVVSTTDGGEADQGGTVSASTGPRQRDDAAETKLRALLPSGYEPSACTAVDPEGNATATIRCAANTDPGGPQSATFSLFGDAAALRTAFTETAAANSVVVCPGNIQTPVHCPTGLSSAFGDSGR